MFGGTLYETSGATYTSYFTNNASRIKKTEFQFAEYWWLRTSSKITQPYGQHFQSIDKNGKQAGGLFTNTNAIIFGFCM